MEFGHHVEQQVFSLVRCMRQPLVQRQKTINTISQSVCITMNMQDCLDINLGLQDGLYIMIEVVTTTSGLDFGAFAQQGSGHSAVRPSVLSKWACRPLAQDTHLPLLGVAGRAVV